MQIINKYINNMIKSKESPILMAGACGSGKSYSVKQLIKDSSIKIDDYVYVDRDIIRLSTPKYQIYTEQNP
jgi:predicted AAA+ superfamily ATPase